MPDPEASSHVLRKPTMDSELYRSSDVRSDRSGEGVTRYQGSLGWQQGYIRVGKEVGSDLSYQSRDGVYRYTGSTGWQQRLQGQIWEEEEEKVEVKTSRWGRYLSMKDVGNSKHAPKSQYMGCAGDPSGNSASDHKYKLPDNDSCVTTKKKSDDSLLYKALDSDCDNVFGRGINCVPNSETQQPDHFLCNAVEDVDGGDTSTTGQYVDEFDDSFDENCLQEDKAMLSVEETTQAENVQHSPYRGSKYIRNTDSSLSPDLFLTQEQKTVCGKFNSPMCIHSGGIRSTSVKTSRKVGLSKFRTPVMSFTSSTLKGSQRSLCGELQFPSLSEVDANVTPSRQVVIPARFLNLQTYKQVITAALREHLNIMLFELSKIYHSALGKVDITQFSGDGGSSKLPGKSTTSSNPPCKCGIPSKLVQVRKEGPNKGRFFYACEAPRNQQCKFFQWMDQPSSTGGGKTSSAAGVTRATLGSADSITAYIRGHAVTFYCQCLYLHKYRDNYNNHRKGIPAWVRQRQEESRKKSMYIKLSKRDASSYYAKDDLWVVSQSLMFDPRKTFIARSVYFGPNSCNEVEIEPISGFSISNWTNNCECHAMLTGNASTELACLGNLEEHVQLSCLPILPYLLDRVEDDQRQRLAALSPARLCTPGHFIMKLAEEYLSRFQLNKDQSEALWRVAAMMNMDAASSEPVLLIHGVFGAGKSFLLSVIIRFLVDVFDKNDSYSPDVPFPWKLLISSTTNVAVDRVLMGLLNLGFEDFIRVGSVKKIAKPVLPYSVHASGTDSQELKDLQEMLRSDIPPGDKQLVRKSIEKHRLGENKKKLGRVRVVGVTCAACSFNCLHNMHFPFVMLDECSQMTEPSSLLPIARFSCEKLVLVGDPKQLDPTIQGSEAAHSDGLEQTLFDRLMKLDYCPVMLRTQYRCHPRISGIANTLFYSGQLCDGVTEDYRQPLSPVFPTLCFYDEAGGQEVTDGSGSYYNESEARLVVLLIHALVMVGVEAGSIGVITLYKAQMYKIITSLQTDNPAVNKELKCVQVSTVDAFQGAEKDVIILSCVRTNNIGFIDSDKRANVALTRARHHLLIVGHQKNLSRNKLWSRVIQLCRAHPGGRQASSTASVELAALVEERQSQTVTGSSQEGQDKDSMGQGKKKKRSRKRKRGKEEEDSPPMSLSGQGVDSSGQSVEVLTPPDAPVNDNMAGVKAADAGIGQKMLLTEDFVLSECSVNTLSKECGKYKRPRRSHLLDPDVFLDDKNNSSDEDLPSYM
ncbi:5'-3' DNA helicase ZGRF1-like [Haliotis asinina]|uniref:5'-3' DNA helicase ZGRF1-like n=1 Tax=Haliotis asinina TaxID=109174 RepID=UPI003531B958